MIAPDGQTIQTDAGVAPDRRVRRLLALTLGGMALSIPVSIIMSAVAEVLVALMAVPVALTLTRDWYVTSAALSYGPFAAAVSLPWLVSATLIWSLVTPYILGQRRRTLIALVGGIVAVLLGYGIATYVAPLLPVTRLHAVTLPNFWQAGGFVVALVAGGLAGFVSVRRAIDLTATPLRGKEILARLITYQALFAFCLALWLEIGVALLTVLNRF